ncbi:hypothetical protein AVEN_152877-1 [Araneus ventricosus]|uniref:Uncharacterized protein n=1 Tax=Araneus ventricosus TaxID=182803 RepID=A0A4Y2ACZ5_ARAVE|nr:hypothetical protein AVEN_152877-1 [Araneus ventricosus]
MILMEKFEDEDFGSIQLEMEVEEMEEVIYLESFMVDFSTNMFALIDNDGDTRMKAHNLCVCEIQEIDGGEYDMIDMRTANLAESKFVSVVNDQFTFSECQFKAILLDRIFEVDCRKEFFGFQVV